MDFDKPKVYGDTFISDGLVYYGGVPQRRYRQGFKVVDSKEKIIQLFEEKGRSN